MQRMAGGGDSDWEFIFDGVFGFLSSPLWSVPMNSFIDAQSVVFEPTEENHLEWTDIHSKYRTLVETLLTSYLKDVGITEEQFMKACTSPSIQRSLAMQQICEQLFAAEDFEIFKKMMIQRNVELELEALKLIQKRQGKKKGQQITSSHIPTEEEIIQEVMKRSEEEYREAQKKRSMEKSVKSQATYDESMEKMISAESAESERLEQDVITKQEDTKRVVQESIKRCDDTPEAPKSEAILEKPSPSPQTVTNPPTCKSPSLPKQPTNSTSTDVSSKSSNEAPKSPTKPVGKVTTPASPTKPVEKVTAPASPTKPVEKGKTPTLPAKTEPTSSQAANQWMENAKQENMSRSTPAHIQKTANLSAEDIKKREAYLKEQRNRIQQMKNQEREKQLLSYTKKGPQRPTSARVAKEAVSGEATRRETTMTDDEQKKLAMRRVLADKLKREVVYKDNL